MNKEEFLEQLRTGLSKMPLNDIEERLAFYSEMIDDRISDGYSEEEAVREVGSVNEILSQVMSEIPLTRLVKEKIKPNRPLKSWEILLLVLGFPLWFPLLIAAFSIILAFYIVIGALIISLWAVDFSFVLLAVVGIPSGIVSAFSGNGLAGVAMIGIGVTSAGLSIFLFFGCLQATKGILLLTKKFAIFIKNLFIKKENA